MPSKERSTRRRGGAPAPCPDYSIVILSREDGLVVATVSGRFGQEAAENLYARVAAEGTHGEVVIDLSGVEYLSSTGIGCLVALASERRIAIAQASEAVRRTLGLAEVSSLFPVCATLEEARAALGRSSEGAGP